MKQWKKPRIIFRNLACLNRKYKNGFNKESIFFLVLTPSESPLPKGTYERVCGKYAELQFDQSKGTFERDDTNRNKGEKERFTLKELEEIIKKEE